MSSGYRSREYWQRVVAEYEQSDWSHAEVAERYGVPVWSFRTWLYRLRREQRASMKSRAMTRVLPVEIVAPRVAAQDGGVRLEVDGTVLQFGVGTDTEYIAALVAALRRAC